ncbi:MAG: HupE/UreJ family protein [Pseudomonadota bacterium]
MYSRLLFGLLTIAVSCVCMAHEPFEITANTRVNADGITISVLITDSTAAKLCLPDANLNSKLHESELATARAQVEQCIMTMFVLQDGELQGKILSAQSVTLGFNHEKDLNATISYPPASSGKLSIKAVYFAKLNDPTYGSTLTATAGDTFLAQKLLIVDDPQIQLTLAATQTPTQSSFAEFYRMGIEHILSGYDHLLFLAGLLVVCLSLRSCLIIITAFTLAHSITLILATLKWVSIPGNLVEMAIAGSIMFVGIENLWRARGNHEPQGRWLLTFGFGLIHGLGFAGALMDVGLPSSGIQLVAPLLAFNLGVETGQLAVAAIVLPCLLWLRKYSWFAARLVPGISILVVAAGLYWLLERMGVF